MDVVGLKPDLKILRLVNLTEVWILQECKILRLVNLTEVWILQESHPQKDEWMTGYFLETRLVDELITQQQWWIWSKDSVYSTIKQRLIEQTQEVDLGLEDSGGSTLVDTLSK